MVLIAAKKLFNEKKIFMKKNLLTVLAGLSLVFALATTANAQLSLIKMETGSGLAFYETDIFCIGTVTSPEAMESPVTHQFWQATSRNLRLLSSPACSCIEKDNFETL
jgi:hypothetical protein